jgi:hypothetical protein
VGPVGKGGHGQRQEEDQGSLHAPIHIASRSVV